MIRLFDTLSGEIRDLNQRRPGKLSMYVCGPTVYDLPHLGHGRYTLVWDIARRWFTFQGIDVHFVSNITDIDDNIINRALVTCVTEGSVAAQYEKEWWSAMDQLGVARPTDVPHATHYVNEMIEIISSLLSKDLAYITSDGVYFDTASLKDYGALAGQSLSSLRAGSRVEITEEKKSPLDFALWKNARVGDPSWDAPFGKGRPGWHTECVVMSLGLLGEGFDLHVGGLDLKFPHHENERAQAVANGHEFARHWAHSGWVMVKGEKMAKSLGNFTSLTDLLEKTDARAYRLLVLRSHYRSPIEITPEAIADGERALARLDSFARRFELPPLAKSTLEVETSFEWVASSKDLYTKITEALNEDLNTPLAVSHLFEAVNTANALADVGKTEEAQRLAMTVNALFGAVGLTLLGEADPLNEQPIDLIQQRDKARQDNDWPEADRLRSELSSLGWIVEDLPAGTTVRRM
jgi:cysteinyl-tRNA synthetase